MGIRRRKGQAGTMAFAILAYSLSGCALEPITLDLGDRAQPSAQQVVNPTQVLIIAPWQSGPLKSAQRRCK
jgi:hypothetical protein